MKRVIEHIATNDTIMPSHFWPMLIARLVRLCTGYT